MRRWGWQRWTAAVAATTLTALAIGVPTGIIHTPFYTRMTAVLWWNYPVWIATSILTGLIVATYVRGPAAAPKTDAGHMTAGWLLSLFAVGCPICNKLVVALLGISGALSIWAPIQPVLGVASVALLSWALWTRLQRERVCHMQQQPTQSSLVN